MNRPFFKLDKQLHKSISTANVLYTDKLLLQSLALLCIECDCETVYPSQKTLSERIGASLSTIKRSIVRLCQAGYISIVNPRDFKSSLRYTVNFARLLGCAFKHCFFKRSAHGDLRKRTTNIDNSNNKERTVNAPKNVCQQKKSFSSLVNRSNGCEHLSSNKKTTRYWVSSLADNTIDSDIDGRIDRISMLFAGRNNIDSDTLAQWLKYTVSRSAQCAPFNNSQRPQLHAYNSYVKLVKAGRMREPHGFYRNSADCKAQQQNIIEFERTAEQHKKYERSAVGAGVLKNLLDKLKQRL